MIVAIAVSLWLTVRWLVRSVLVLPFDLLRFSFRSFTGFVFGGTVALVGLIAVGAWSGGLSVQQRSAAYVGVVFAAAVLARWRSARKRPRGGRGWPRFIVAWVVGGPAAWLLPSHYLMTAGRPGLLGSDWVVLFVLAWVVVAIIVRSDRLARALTLVWKAERQRNVDADLIGSLRPAPPAPPDEPGYGQWYAWSAAVAGGPAGALHEGALAAQAVLRSGGTPEAAAAAARRKTSGSGTGLASLRRRWNTALEAATPAN
jgi:hypothetical protein